MVTLHIEHPVTDLDVWQTAFGRFADARAKAGVRAHRIQQPIANDHYVFIDLDFDTVAAAEAFRHFLTTVVWAIPANSPALAGTPTASVRRDVGVEARAVS